MLSRRKLLQLFGLILVLSLALMPVAGISAQDDEATLTITPDSGPPGTDHVIEISGVEPGLQVLIDFILTDTAEVVYTASHAADDDGLISFSIFSNDEDVPGEYLASARIADGTVIAQGTFTIEEAPEPTVTSTPVPSFTPTPMPPTEAPVSPTPTITSLPPLPTSTPPPPMPTSTEPPPMPTATIAPTLSPPTGVEMTIDPASGIPGTTHIIVITGLEAEATVDVNVEFEGEVVFSNPYTANEEGIASFTIFSEENDVPGVYTVSAYVDDEFVASAEIVVEQGPTPLPPTEAPPAGIEMTVDPEEGSVGTTHNFEITGLEAEETITVEVLLDDEELVFTSEYTADENGVVDFRLISEVGDAPGDYTVAAFRDGEMVASVGMTVTESVVTEGNITITPAEGPIGTNHVIQVSGLAPEQEITISMTLAETQETLYTAERTADDDGVVSLTIYTETGDEIGVYIVTAASGGEIVAQAELLVQEAEEPILQPSRTPTPTPQAGDITPIAVGDRLQGELTAGEPAARYSFSGASGDIVTITLESEDFDAYLLLEDEDGNLLTEDDDSAGRLNSRITDFTLPADGTYIIVATSLQYERSGGARFGTGDFTLSFGTSGVVIGEPQTDMHYDEVIGIDETVTGSVNANQPRVIYAFVGEAGEAVTISLTSPEYDTYLTLQNAEGMELMYNDDGGEGLNSLLGPYTLPYDGTYLIVAESYSSHGGGDSTVVGSFELSLTAVAPRLIEYTQMVDGELLGTTPYDLYSFTGQEGDVISITMNAGAYSTYLNLASSDAPEQFLTSHDSSFTGESNRSQIGPFTLPHTGEYIIQAGGYAEYAESGTYTLRLDRVSLIPIAYGETVEAEFTGLTTTAYFSFEAEAGDVISIAVTGDGDVDTALTVMSPYNAILTYDDDGGVGFNPEINSFLLEQRGTHTIQLATYARGEIGAVTLTLERDELQSLDEDTQRVRLNDKRTQIRLVFEGVAGQNVRLIVQIVSAGESSEPQIWAEQDGETIGMGMSSHVSQLAIDFVVPADGEVDVIVEDLSLSGSVLDVSLERNP